MDCPVCTNAMVTLELADVEIDHCLHCGGIWLDAGELELLMDDPRQAQRLLGSFQETPHPTEKPRKCPICDRRMVQIRVGRTPPPLHIDKCRKDHGLWFDRGELEAILERGQLDENSRIQRLLADMFGRSMGKSETGGES